MTVLRRSKRLILPVTVFVGTVTAHMAYKAMFPDAAPEQDRWAAPPQAEGGWSRSYVESGMPYLGLSYACSITFAVVMFRRYRERRLCADRNLAIGGITLSGVLSVVGCFLIGCCGSPMLGVYVSLLGPWFLPWTGPMTLGLTLLSLGGGSWWMWRRERRAMALVQTCPTSAICECGPVQHHELANGSVCADARVKDQRGTAIAAPKIGAVR